MRNFFDFILENASEAEAIETAQGLDWSEIEIEEEKKFPYLNYIDTINGVGIWYNFECDSYYFTDESDEVE